MIELTIDQTKEMVIAACDAIISSKDYLTEVDSRIGDGDHGIGMSGGMQKAKAALLTESTFQDINSIFKTAGMAMLNSMGGASGIIFGSLFLGGLAELGSIRTLKTETFINMMRGALESIKKRGHAQVGDKTMVDALEPAVIAMENGASKDFIVILQAAWKAAAKGLENTKMYTAKFGRAKSLMERAVGYQDAGATSVTIIFEAMCQYVMSQDADF